MGILHVQKCPYAILQDAKETAGGAPLLLETIRTYITKNPKAVAKAKTAAAVAMEHEGEAQMGLGGEDE